MSIIFQAKLHGDLWGSVDPLAYSISQQIEYWTEQQTRGVTRCHYTANHFEASSQATVLSVIGKAPRNYIEEKRKKKNNKLFRYCDDIPIPNMILSERVILPLTAITRSCASHIHKLKRRFPFNAHSNFSKYRSNAFPGRAHHSNMHHGSYFTNLVYA